MKAFLHFRVSKALAERIRRQFPAWLELAVADPDDTGAVSRHLSDAEVLLHVLTPADKTLLDVAPRLRLIQKIGVGVNTIDLEEASRRGIHVANMPGTNSVAVAEMTLALMLAAMRRIVLFDQATRRGEGWRMPADVTDTVSEINGKVVGLIGFGEVPRKLAPVLMALGACVIYTNRGRHVETNAERVTMDDLIRRSDIISLHIPATPETRELISRERFAQMKPGVVVVNTARGELFDEQALYDNLISGHVRCAGLDVLGREPARHENPLFALDNVVVAPHVAWLTAQTVDRSLSVAIENCRRLRDDEPLLHQVMGQMA